MKCPKCGYLGFEHVDRCRNCGYDFSLAHQPPVPELPMRPAADTANTFDDDLSLVDAATAPAPAPFGDLGPDLERVLGAPVTSAPSAPSSELPLFGGPDDEPLIKKASPPRPPLAVRRATPDVPRVRSEPRAQSLDLGLDLDRTVAAQPALSPASEATEDAGVAARFIAAMIDLLILSIVDAVVVYFTMQICGLSFAEIGILPKIPLVAFLLVQNGGYLVAFTAGGQTLGKMAAGIRVVPAESESPLDVGRAFLRTIVWLLLAVPAGLGFLTAVLSHDHRGLHDRFAGTRVVR